MLAGITLAAPGANAADQAPTLRAALEGGRANLDLRLRHESVDTDNPAKKDAEANTVRTRLGYTTGAWNGFDAGIEFEGVSHIGSANYSPTPAGSYAVVADPDSNELNQAYIRYTGIAGTTLKYGRQRIVLDNARFVGNVGWRQNEQTYDALSVTGATWLPKTTVRYAFLTDANTIIATDRPLHGHLLNVSYALAPELNLVAYGYLLDWATGGVPTPPADSRTLGLRATGAVALGAGKFGYALEYAQQSDYADASFDSHGYSLAELGYGVPAVGVKLGYELLGGDGASAFQTPLATLHAFNGWADLFLSTPATGLRDVYLQAGGTAFQKLGWMVRSHRFDADTGSADYGKELDAQLTWAFLDTLSVGAKYANYDAKDFSFDTTKTWAWVEYRF
ncbi:MAG: alginate export family protein [Gammaproteobacteria bacterium]|nr:alginate export family protein [Gammaproteobacteria bacterium]